MSQPFLNCPSSSKDFNFTSSKGIKCCKLSGDDIIQNVEKTNLFVVLFLVDYNVSIDEQIIEEEELPGLWLFPACFCQYPLSHKNPA